MTIEEMLLFAKILAFVFGDKSVELTDTDKELAFETLKKMTDRRLDMTEQQKQQFKLLVEYCKHYSR